MEGAGRTKSVDALRQPARRRYDLGFTETFPMLRVHPFQALRPSGSRAALVSCPPPELATSVVEAPTDESFRHVLLAENDDRARGRLRRLFESGILSGDPEPALYLYRIAREGKRLIGIVGCVERDDLDDADGEPAAPPWREPATALYEDPDGTVAALAAEDMNERPIFHFNSGEGADAGSTHTGWLVHDAARYVKAFAALPAGARLVTTGASAGNGRLLTLLFERGAADPLPTPRCGLFVQRAAIG